MPADSPGSRCYAVRNSINNVSTLKLHFRSSQPGGPKPGPSTAPQPGPSTALQPPTSDVATSTTTVRKVNRNNCILVHPKQRGNPLLKSITNIPWEFDEAIVPDYVVGATTCVLFLSLKYHNLNPDYIHSRIKQLAKMFELRILLAQVDLKEPHSALKNITRVCLLTDFTLMLAWSPEEAGRIIESYKALENKPPDLIRERQEQNSHEKVGDERWM